MVKEIELNELITAAETARILASSAKARGRNQYRPLGCRLEGIPVEQWIRQAIHEKEEREFVLRPGTPSQCGSRFGRTSS
jgi:hypothetical protein